MDAAILLHRRYGLVTFRERLHTLIRFLTCPFLRVLPFVPAGSSVLDVGAGHGLFSTLALGAGAGRAVGVEPDLRKVFAVGKPLVAGYDSCIRGTFDVVAVIDVLYKIPLAEWDAFFGRMFERVGPGGTLLLKEQDPTEKLKNGWNRIQEKLASLLGITLGEAFAYEAPNELKERLLRHGFREVAVQRIDRFYPHPHVLYVARR